MRPGFTVMIRKENNNKQTYNPPKKEKTRNTKNNVKLDIKGIVYKDFVLPYQRKTVNSIYYYDDCVTM